MGMGGERSGALQVTRGLSSRSHSRLQSGKHVDLFIQAGLGAQKRAPVWHCDVHAPLTGGCPVL